MKALVALAALAAVAAAGRETGKTAGNCSTCGGPLVPSGSAGKEGARLPHDFVADTCGEAGISPARLRALKESGMKPGIFETRFLWQKAMVLPLDVFTQVVEAYDTEIASARQHLSTQQGLTGWALGMAATKAARLAVGHRLVTPSPEGARARPGFPAVVPLGGMRKGQRSVLQDLGEIRLVEAQSPRASTDGLPPLITPAERKAGYSTPALHFGGRDGRGCGVVLFAFDGSVSLWPGVARVPFLTETSKMSAPSFSLPAGAQASGGTCQSAAIRSFDPCQPNICAMCYALAGNYQQPSTALPAMVRLEWVRQLIDRDPTGKLLGQRFAAGISSYARWGTGGERGKQEIGVWNGTEIVRGTGRRVGVFPTRLASRKHPKRLMRLVTNKIAERMGDMSVAPRAVSEWVTGARFASNRVPGGKIRDGSIRLSPQTVAPDSYRFDSGRFRTASFLKMAKAGQVVGATCERIFQVGQANAGTPVSLGASSTKTIFRGRAKGEVAGFFRIHDAGDVSVGRGASGAAAYLAAWIECARLLPGVYFWQPTRAWLNPPDQMARVMGEANTLPNFAIRPSAIEANERAPAVILPTGRQGLRKSLHHAGHGPGREGAAAEAQWAAAYEAAPADQKLAAGSTVNSHVGKVKTSGKGTVGQSNLGVYVTDWRGIPAWACPVYSLVVKTKDGYGQATSCHTAGCRFCWLARDYPVTYGAH